MSVGSQVQMRVPATDRAPVVNQLEVDVEQGHIAVRGELDLATVERLSSALARAGDGRHQPVVVDLRQLHFIDSTGISVLFRANAALSAQRRRLEILVAPSSCIQRAFEVSGVAALLDIRPTAA